MVRALAGVALAMKRIDLTALFLVGFNGVLRTCEIVGLRRSQLSFSPNGLGLVVRLPQTKTTGAKNAPESVLIDDVAVIRALRWACEGLGPTDRILQSPATRFGDDLRMVARAVGFESPRLTPYAFRRGGATWWFRVTGSLDFVMARGRWSQQRTARLYIDCALAEESNWELSPAGKLLAADAASILADCLRAHKRPC